MIATKDADSRLALGERRLRRRDGESEIASESHEFLIREVRRTLQSYMRDPEPVAKVVVAEYFKQ
jgi:hypothetical protein